MSTLHAYLAFAIANPLKILTGFVAICSIVVALTPAKYQKSKIFGILLVIANRASILVHADRHGTLQSPVIAKALFFGDMPAPAVAAPAAVQATPAATADAPKAS